MQGRGDYMRRPPETNLVLIQHGAMRLEWSAVTVAECNSQEVCASKLVYMPRTTCCIAMRVEIEPRLHFKSHLS